MKKSTLVINTLLTGGVLTALLHHNAVYRDNYASQEDCLADWNQNPANCEASSGSGTAGGAGGGFYRGPTYEEGSRPTTPQQQRVAFREMVKRSGFGSSGARFSGGG